MNTSRKCPNCGAPWSAGSIHCGACGSALTSDHESRQTFVGILQSLDADLDGASTGLLTVLALGLFLIPITLLVGGWIYGHTLWGIGLSVAVILSMFLLIGLEVERAADRHFVRHTKPRLAEIARELRLTKTQLLALVVEGLPEHSKLRKRITTM